MMSSVLISHVRSIYFGSKSDITEADACDEDENEPITLCIAVDNDGNLMIMNQFHDYYYRGPTLASMNFYDFAQCIKCEKITTGLQTIDDGHLGKLTHHLLLKPHALADTHQLVQIWNDNEEYGPNEFVC